VLTFTEGEVRAIADSVARNRRGNLLDTIEVVGWQRWTRVEENKIVITDGLGNSMTFRRSPKEKK
jgi:hypothetical protein